MTNASPDRTCVAVRGGRPAGDVGDTGPTTPSGTGFDLRAWTPGSLGWLLCGTIVFPLLVLQLLSADLPGPHAILVRQRVLVGAGALAVIAWVALLGPRRLRCRLPTLPLLVGGSATLLVLAIVWNHAFLAAWSAGYDGYVFRRVFRSVHAPFYGDPRAPIRPWSFATFGIACAFVLALARRPKSMLTSNTFVWCVAVLQLALIYSIAASEHPLRPFGQINAFASFGAELAYFDGARDLLATYVEKMPTLPWSGRHYPPGFLLVLELAASRGLATVARIAFVLLAVATVVPVRALTAELGLARPVGNAAAALCATSATLLVYPSLTPHPVLAFVTATIFWLLVRALRGGGAAAALALGLAVAVFAFTHFAVYVLAFPIGCFTALAIASRCVTAARAVRVAAVALVGFTVPFVLLGVTTGFDLLACFLEAMRSARESGGPLLGDPVDYALRSTGSLIAYACSVGPPVVVLAVASIGGAGREPRATSLQRCFFVGTVVGIALAAWNGHVYLETERLWIFFTPLLAVAAGFEVERRMRSEGAPALLSSLAMSLAFACVYALYFRHHFYRF